MKGNKRGTTGKIYGNKSGTILKILLNSIKIVYLTTSVYAFLDFSICFQDVAEDRWNSRGKAGRSLGKGPGDPGTYM